MLTSLHCPEYTSIIFNAQEVHLLENKNWYVCTVIIVRRAISKIQEMQEMIEICFPIHPTSTYKMVLVYQVLLYRQSERVRRLASFSDLRNSCTENLACSQYVWAGWKQWQIPVDHKYRWSTCRFMDRIFDPLCSYRFFVYSAHCSDYFSFFTFSHSQLI